MVDRELTDRTLASKLIAPVPSLDTGVCSMMTKPLNEAAKKFPQIQILVISADLPFAQQRFCVAESVNRVFTLSMMRDKEFGKAYGVLIYDQAFKSV